MKSVFHFCNIALCGLILCGSSLPAISDTQGPIAADALPLPNFHQPREHVITSGQPSADQLTQLQKAGIKHVINLRPDTEMQWDEEEAVTALGMQYHHIPVTGAAGVTAENAAALQSLLDSLADETVLVHCASGNRVGALAAINAGEHSASIDQAIAEGKRWGLTGLEALVRDKLSSNTQLCCAEDTGADNRGQ